MFSIRWKHKKTGNLYQIVSYVIIEKTLTPAVCYEPVDEPNAMFIRPCAEFFDGRFEMIDVSKGPPAQALKHTEPDPEDVGR